MRLRVLLPLVLLLAGCQSERAVFRFTPSGSSSHARHPTPAPAVADAALAARAAAPRPVAVAGPVPPARTVRKAHVAPARAALPARLAARPRPAETAARRAWQPPAFLGSRPAERAFLIGGASTTLLGLLANYLAIGATSSRMLLLDTGHFLLILGSLLLLAWFVLLLVRALKE